MIMLNWIKRLDVFLAREYLLKNDELFIGASDCGFKVNK